MCQLEPEPPPIKRNGTSNTIDITFIIDRGDIKKRATALLDTGNDAADILSLRVVEEWNLLKNLDPRRKCLINYAGIGAKEMSRGVIRGNVCMIAPLSDIESQAFLTFQVLNISDEMIISLPTLLEHFLRPTIELMIKAATIPLVAPLEDWEAKHSSEGQRLCVLEVAKELRELFDSTHNKAEGEEVLPGQVVLPSLHQEVAEEENIIREPTLFGEECEDRVNGGEAKCIERMNSYKTNYHKSFSAEMWTKHSKEIDRLMTSAEAMGTFTFKEWTGVRMDPIKLEFKELPSYTLQKTRVICTQIKEEAKIALDKFVDSGNLVREERSSHGASLVVVAKPDGTARICGDYRQVNKYLANIPYIMPDIAESIEKMRGFKYYAELDWTTAFRQLPIDEETGRVLCVTTPWGIFRPRFVPEGIACGVT